MIALELAQVVVATVATICMIALGFLYRPSLASALWSLTFVVVMVTSYAAMVGMQVSDEPLRVAAMGVLLATPALLWSGLRAHRGARSHAWIAVVLAVIAAVTMTLLIGSDVYAWAFRVAFAASASFSGLTLVELVRRPERGGGTSAPLAAFSLVVVAVGAISLVAGLVTGDTSPESLAFLRTVNSLGLLAYIVCALITLLFLTRGNSPASTGSVFRDVASDRLSRAQRAGERSWALVYVQLDDADDLRAVSGDAGFTAIVARLRADIEELFPTEADIGRVGVAAFAILVAQPSTVVRERVRGLLRAVAAPHDVVQVGTSASLGWAGVAEFGYDVDALLDAAQAAADRAAAAGGDRWERALG